MICRQAGPVKQSTTSYVRTRNNETMNTYLKNLKKIEFAVTMACTGKCKHCQNGESVNAAEHMDAAVAEKAIREVCAHYRIETVMTFGGEPLLYPDVVGTIHRTAAALGVDKRQVITNGFFSKEPGRIETVVRELADSGINELLLSVDAFHQETIPLEPVLLFAECAVNAGIPIRLTPAWLVSPEDQNPYNLRTAEVIRAFAPLPIPVGPGNVIFPSGNALKYLREYIDEDVVPSTPYEEDPRDVRALSFSANGDVLNGNIYQMDILEIIRTYQP